MMSLMAIRAVNEEIAVEAARQRRVPFVPWNSAEVEEWNRLRFPNLGYYEPPGWEKTETAWFIDKTGVGRSYEPALTLDQFRRQLADYVDENPGHGFAITEEGEFQAVISAFRPVNGKSSQR